MKSTLRSVNQSRRKAALLPALTCAVVLLLVCLANWCPASQASAGASRDDGQQVIAVPNAGDTCVGATVINPATLPFFEDSTTAGAGNDVDPGGLGCVLGAGPDVVYRFTPAVTDVYTIGATPIGVGFDLTLYIVTDCVSPAVTCLVGANARGFGDGEFVAVTLAAGTAYFIVVDSPAASPSSSGPFHFSLRRGVPSNDTCASATLVEPSRLPFSAAGTTFGAANDIAAPCLSSQSSTGRDVVFQFTPVDTQTYIITVTPNGNYDTSVYVVRNCVTGVGCVGKDVFGGGHNEILGTLLNAGTAYFIVVDGNGGDAGDFNILIEPSIPMSPLAPTSLVANAVSVSQIDLTWMDKSNNEIGFRILRSLNGFDFGEIATVGSNVTMYSDSTVAPKTTYFYEVVAFNNFGTSGPSNIADATTPDLPVPREPRISVVPEMIDFGSVGPSQTAEAMVRIMNVGGADLIVSSISDPTGTFSILNKPALPLTLAPDGSVDLTVRFRPNAAAMFASSFTIVSNDPTRPSVTVDLKGLGTAAPVPNLEITPPVFDFPSGSSSTACEFKNTGDADLIVSSVILPKAPFSLTGGPAFPAMLKPGESFVASVAFSPAGVGVFEGSFIAVSNDPDGLLRTVRLRGTSTASSEVLKLRAPTLVTAIAGATTTLNVLAANGTNTDIRLQASAVTGGTFTDRGNGRGDLVFSPGALSSGVVLVTYTARDGSNRVKSLQGAITILGNANTHRVQVMWTLASASPNPPTDVLANDLSVTPLASAQEISLEAVAPADAPGLIGYLVHVSQNQGVAATLSNVAGIVLTGQTSFTHNAPTPSSSSQVFFYNVSALYGTGTESGGSNETSSAPRMVGLKFKAKTVRFDAANSNVATGATFIVDGSESFLLVRSGDLIMVDKNARSTPGGLRTRDIFTGGSSHGTQVRNPNGVVSAVVTLVR